MKIVFFGPTLLRSHADHRSRVLATLLEGVVDRGHHVVYVEPEGAAHGNTYPFSEFVRVGSWAGDRDRIDAECSNASAIVVVSGFPGGHEAVEWLLELPVPARAYYELDPWETIEAFDREGAAPWLRADQVAAFNIVFSVAGGPALEPFANRWGAEETIALYEAIDPAVWHPRSPSEDLASDLALVADRHAPAEAAVEAFVLPAARALPTHRFVVAGAGWEAATGWPENVELLASGGADDRATLYSSARVVLVPASPHPIDFAMPSELLEAAACAAACAVVDRPGLSGFFRPGREILVPASGADLVPVITSYTDAQLRALGRSAEKRVVLDYSKLPAAVTFEQRLARKFFAGTGGHE